MRRARRTDPNQTEIVLALRQAGVSVEVTSDIGRGFPDLVAGYHGRTFLLEIKRSTKDPLTTHESWFRLRWNGHYAVVCSIDDAFRTCGIPVQATRQLPAALE
jgi:hypothetical protein